MGSVPGDHTVPARGTRPVPSGGRGTASPLLALASAALGPLVRAVLANSGIDDFPGAAARVAVRATAESAAGTHPITLEFRPAGGTRLVPSRVEADIR